MREEDRSPDRSDAETLRKALEIEWRDHFQTRAQTWRTLMVSALLVAALFLAALAFDSPWILTALGSFVGFVCLLGAAVAWHHRKAQARKFTHIDRIEEALGLHVPGLLDDVHPPTPPKAADLANPSRMNTPLLILRIQLTLVLCALVFIAAVWLRG